MDRKLYLIPALVSVALHGVLFLNRDNDVPPPPPSPTVVSLEGDRAFPTPEIPETTPVDLPDDTPVGKLGGGMPTLEECLSRPDANGVRMEVVFTRASTNLSNLTHIAAPGTPGGIDFGEVGSGAGRIKAISAVDLDTTPNARYRISPRYPDNAKREGIEGDVLVDFLVNENGDVIRVSVVNSSDPRFVEPTRAAVLRWRFAPGVKNGKVVPFKMRVPVHFSLNNEA